MRTSRVWRRRTFRQFSVLQLECLEERTLLSASAAGFATPYYVVHGAGNVATPYATSGPTGYTPAQVSHAYGFDQISFTGGVKGDGSGTTIAIVDAYDDPNIANDLHQFDVQFGLADPTFTKVNQTGGTTYPPPDSGWATEIALDVEWAHAIAPGAKILLVEATDNSFTNLLAGVTYAASQSNVVAVSTSWGGGEFSGETSYDSTFTTPSGHTGVTFVASSGDAGAPVSYPAASPNVLSVGGTTLNLSGSNYVSESGWSGSGGGISSQESQPTYQKGVVTQSTTARTNPDVSYDADPNTGFPVYDSYNNGTITPWEQVGGTSDAAPQWAALIAIADQGRAIAGKSALDGPSQALPAIYKLSSGDFHDVTSGTSTGSPNYTASAGYDLVTGIGSPIANKVVADLVGNSSSVTHFTVSAASTTTAGSPLSVAVTALDANNNVVTGYTGTVHFTSTDTAAGLPADYTFTGSDSGAHTFSVTLKTAGSQTVTVTDTSSSTINGSTSVTVSAASANHVGFGTQPTNAVAGTAISPAITAKILDAYNNVITTDQTDSITLALANNPGGSTLSGTNTVTVVNGVATFSTLSLNKTGTGYTLKATSGSLTAATSSAFNITPAKASQLAFAQQPTNTPAGSTINPAVTVQLLDAFGNLATNDSTDAITMAIGTNPVGGTLSGTLTVTASAGVASFSNLAISKAGTGYTLKASSGSLTGATSNTFNVTPAGTHLFFSQQPTNTAAGSSISAVVVEVLDANNNVVTTDNSDKITLALGSNPGGGTLSGTTSITVSAGVATFSNLSINKTGTGYTLSATAPTLTSATSSAFNITPGTATHVAFVQQPTSVAAGAAISPAITVELLDANNNIVTSDSTDSVTLALANNPGGSTLGGTTSVTVSAGIATFSNITLNKTGTGYTLKASSGSLTTATSSAFNVTPGKADHLAYLQQPTNTAVGAVISPAVTVEVLDVNNNVVTTDSTDTISLAFGSNPGGATLGGTTSVTVSAGVATFSTLTVSATGTGYTLSATSGSLKSATSASFNVTNVTATVIENFENGLGNYYVGGSYYAVATTDTQAAHDGSYGLDMWSSPGWIYRNDSAAQVKQGEVLSTWLQFGGTADGRAYFGFGASANGTLSLVAAPNTGQLILQDNSGYGFTNLATVSQSYQANHWYRLEVTWATGGSITGKLYDSDGKTLINTVQATATDITSGGIAFRATWSDKYFDTVTMSTISAPHVVTAGGSNAATAGVASPAGDDLAGPVASSIKSVSTRSLAEQAAVVVQVQSNLANSAANSATFRQTTASVGTAPVPQAAAQRVFLDSGFAGDDSALPVDRTPTTPTSEPVPADAPMNLDSPSPIEAAAQETEWLSADSCFANLNFPAITPLASVAHEGELALAIVEPDPTVVDAESAALTLALVGALHVPTLHSKRRRSTRKSTPA